MKRFDGQNIKSWNKSNRTHLIDEISSITKDDEGWFWLCSNKPRVFVFFHPDKEQILTTEDRFSKPYSKFGFPFDESIHALN